MTTLGERLQAQEMWKKVGTWGSCRSKCDQGLIGSECFILGALSLHAVIPHQPASTSHQKGIAGQQQIQFIVSADKHQVFAEEVSSTERMLCAGM